ncbi:hypothetical protein ACSSS7_000927 [Eimeria intestinalis]
MAVSSANQRRRALFFIVMEPLADTSFQDFLSGSLFFSSSVRCVGGGSRFVAEHVSPSARNGRLVLYRQVHSTRVVSVRPADVNQFDRTMKGPAPPGGGGKAGPAGPPPPKPEGKAADKKGKPADDKAKEKT